MKKFEVGDRVVVNGNVSYRDLKGVYGYVIDVTPNVVGVEFDEFVDGHNCRGIGKSGYCWYMGYNECEVVKPKVKSKKALHPIVIYIQDEKVIAKDCVTEVKAYARCHPDDAFNYEVGAKLALERLFEESKPKYNGKVVCIEDALNLIKVGTILTFKDGDCKYGGIPVTKTPCESLDDLNSRFERTRFVEVIE